MLPAVSAHRELVELGHLRSLSDDENSHETREVEIMSEPQEIDTTEIRGGWSVREICLWSGGFRILLIVLNSGLITVLFTILYLFATSMCETLSEFNKALNSSYNFQMIGCDISIEMNDVASGEFI